MQSDWLGAFWPISQEQKKNHFWGHFLNFWSKNLFSKNQAVMYNFIRVSSLLQNPEKSHDRSWQISGGKDGQTLYHRVLPATAKWLTSTAAVDWHLKVKDKKRDVGLTKNYNITVSLQKISSIHKFIQQILGSHKLNDQTHFWPDPPQNYWNNF